MNSQTYMRNRTMHYLDKIFVLFLVLVSFGCSEKDTVNAAAEDYIKTDYVKELPEYPTHKLPDGLEWETNNEEPLYASPEAKRGGVYNAFVLGFPLTLRVVGPDSASAFRPLLNGNQLSLTDMHPNTHMIVPSLATHWAYDNDGRTVYYKLDQRARWSDGKPVTADDYLFTRDFMRSKHIVSPWHNKQYEEEIIDIKKYDDYTISVTGSKVKPQKDLHYYYGLVPKPRHFHKLDENWVADYNWRVEPNTGPYKISKIKKGKYVEFVLKEDWWAKDLRLIKNRYNVKKIRIKVIRDMETAYRHFLKQEIDSFNVSLPTFWHDKAVGEEFDKGYIHKIWFYNDMPRYASGLFLNQDYSPLEDINVRLGLHHAMNFKKIINTVLRGDYVRLHTLDTGYGEYTNTEIRAREFDLDKADYCFDKAGWDERGSDGIRVKDGKRLSFSITYGTNLHNEKIVILKEEAKKAGVEINLDLLDSSAWFKKLSAQKHQIAWLYQGGGIRPQYWGSYHSDNAHKPDTNNHTATADPELDALIEEFRKATNLSAGAELARKIQQKIHDLAVVIPLTMAPYTRNAYWRWMKFPEVPGTKWSESIFEAIGSGLFWIDEEEKEKTLAAIKKGQVFEPVTIIDTTYKTK